MSYAVASSSADRSSAWLKYFSKLLCFFTVVLIFVGSLVTSHDAGLSVPDWPTSYGHSMFTFPISQWVGGIFYEHTHRLLASAVGTLTVCFVVALWFLERRTWVRYLGYAALLAVVCQGVLGGLTVLFGLPALVSTGHAVLAQTFFILTIIIAYVESDEFFQAPQHTFSSTTIFKLSVLLVALVYIQLIVGAYMRHSGAGLAIPDFPRMGGSYHVIPNAQMLERVNALRVERGLSPVTLGQLVTHLGHRFGAVVVTTLICYLSFQILRVKRSFPHVRKTMIAIIFLVVAQILLGVVTVWGERPVLIASAHVLTGACILALCVLLSLRIFCFGFDTHTAKI